MTSPARAVVQLTVDELEQLVRAAVRDELDERARVRRVRKTIAPSSSPPARDAREKAAAALARADRRRERKAR